MKTKIKTLMHHAGLKLNNLRQGRLFSDNGGFGMNELLGIAAALIIAAFVVIPGLKTFASSVMSGLTTWWSDIIDGKIFPTT